MGKKKKTKMLEKEIADLVKGLDRGSYSPEEVLTEVLMDLYEAKKTLKKDQSQEIHAKVWEILEAVRQRADAQSLRDHSKYFRVYQGLCKELRLDERPAYLPKLEESAKNNGEVLTKEFSSLILAFQREKLTPEYFLRQGLDELTDMASEVPVPRMRFARARELYANVMDFLGNSGVYGGVESYRQEYQTLLAKVNGNSKQSSKSNSAGIGRRAFNFVREPRRDFRKGLSR